ncbi:MAG TPA: TIGR04282 family arsenosugar biosynthesis glycosyltransferase [Ignavibacteriaceae bacterium]|nr:TIGR04282 family arsenosugar biosynthesis glycosyltransferase [Ignavibacteriaceae bacterium]
MKYPEPGNVKTRIADQLGGNFAAAFYKACAGYILNECLKLKESGIDLFIFYMNPEHKEKFETWVSDRFKLVCQEGENLGERMYNAFSFLFKNKNDKIILIGSDIPDISAALIQKSFEYLDSYDAVLGPSSDGGYYLIGLTKLNKKIFTNIPWSTDKVFELTLSRLKQKDLSCMLMQKLIDIDKEEDITEWLKTNPGDDHPVKIFLMQHYKKLLGNFCHLLIQM